MSEFDDAIVLSGPDASGSFQAALSEDWKIGEAVNGGLLMALAARAAGDASAATGGHHDSLSHGPSGMSSSGFVHRLDMRLDPATAGWTVGSPSGRGEMRGWLRFADGRPPDALSLLLALDAFPPVVFDLGSTGWAPTIEFTGYVRARPAPGWLQVRTQTQHVAGGLFNEDCEIWDSTGALVAQSRQLGSARFPAAQP